MSYKTHTFARIYIQIVVTPIDNAAIGKRTILILKSKGDPLFRVNIVIFLT